jgi:DHA2 family multidrug resistance protein
VDHHRLPRVERRHHPHGGLAQPAYRQEELPHRLQGIGGGGLVPISQSILLESFPREKHGTAMAIFGMGAMLGPILGPLLGGWITDNWSWRWIFYINIPIGILSIIMNIVVIQDPPYM